MLQSQIPLPIHLQYPHPSVGTWIARVFVLLISLSFMTGAVYALTAADTTAETYPNWVMFIFMLVAAILFTGLLLFIILKERMQLAIIDAAGVTTSQGNLFAWQNLVQIKIYTADHIGVFSKRMKQKVVFEFNNGKVKYYGNQPDFYLVSDIAKNLPFHFQEILI